MKDLTEAELIEMERRARQHVETLEPDPQQMRNNRLIDAFNAAFDEAETVAADVANLCEHLRAYTAIADTTRKALLTGFAIGLESK